MTLISPVHYTLVACFFVVVVISSYGQWHFRKERSIDLRSMPAMVHCAWLCFSNSVIDLLRVTYYDEQFAGGYCWVFRLRFVTEHQNTVTLLFAAYRVVFFMELAAHLAKTRDSQNRANLLAGRGGWYVKHRHWMDWKYNQWFFLVQGLLMLTAVLIIAAFDNGCGNLNAFRMFGPFVNAGYLVTLAYIMYRLAYCGRDAFGIKVDLAKMAFTVIILKATAYGLVIQNGESQYGALTESLILLGASFCVVFFLVLLPVLRVMRSRETFTEPTTLEELVTRPSGYESFLEFLNSEFASESLHFWNNVNLYRARAPNMPDTKARMEYANEITETFIRPNAVLEVNLTSSIKNKVYETLALCQKDCDEGNEHPELLTIFDVAQTEMMKVMSRDNFRRYLKSPQYDSWKEEQTSTTKRVAENSSTGQSTQRSTHASSQNMSSHLQDDSLSKRGNVLAVVVTRAEGGGNGFERLHTPRPSQEPPSTSSPVAQVNVEVPSESDNELP